jgi:UDP-3-O-[3-hydroxymyristoyl] N-acetylglucosamine deacetylase/3-hydroxyacyl-[acyl-carrier-protein] dehydratase
MNIKQRTIKSSFSLSGVGLHTGEAVTITFKAAPDKHGYTFSRVDLPGNPVIDADVDNVTDTSRGTTISQNGASVSTIEHVLAALVGCEVDNVLMELDGPEVPIMDGSSIEFIDALEKAGFVDQETDREYYTIPANIHYTEPDRKVEMVAMPLDDYRFTCMIDYNSPILGSQHAAITTLSEFKKEIASCRTFCFLHELEMLLENNLIKGGDLNNAIVVVDKEISKEELKHLAKIFNKDDIDVAREGILNNIKLRHQNEPARHKLLDMIGDLALVGVPIKGHIMAARPGHAAYCAGPRAAAVVTANSHRPIIDVAVCRHGRGLCARAQPVRGGGAPRPAPADHAAHAAAHAAHAAPHAAHAADAVHAATDTVHAAADTPTSIRVGSRTSRASCTSRPGCCTDATSA